MLKNLDSIHVYAEQSCCGFISDIWVIISIARMDLLVIFITKPNQWIVSLFMWYRIDFRCEPMPLAPTSHKCYHVSAKSPWKRPGKALSTRHCVQTWQMCLWPPITRWILCIHAWLTNIPYYITNGRYYVFACVCL